MGLRAGELHALKIDRLNLLHGSLDVVASLSEVRGQIQIGQTKTGKTRRLLVPKFLMGKLRAPVAAYPSGDGFVFTASEGGPIRHRNFYRRHFKPAVTAAGLPASLRFHDLRHTCAALLIANGRHMEEVKEYLGHSSIRVTSDRYGHLFPKAREDLRDGLDRLFSEVTVKPATNLRGILEGFSEQIAEDETDYELEDVLSPATSLERTTGFEPATLTLAR